MLAVPSPVSYSTSATAGSRITVGRSTVREGGFARQHYRGVCSQEGFFSAGGPMDGVAAPYNCLTPVVLLLHHLHATSFIHIFYSHCTSMSTSFLMLPPMVFVARQV